MFKMFMRVNPLNNLNHVKCVPQLFKRAFLLLLSLTLFACASVDKRFTDPEHRGHPAMQVFLDYDKAVKASDEFNDELKAFFSASDQKKIAATMGWQRLVYTTSYKGLKQGVCEDIAITQQSITSVLISCKGPFTYQSAFGYSRQETMELRVFVRKVIDQWYISSSGMKHTMDGGESVPRSTGIKFN